MYPESIYQYEMLKRGYRVAELFSPVIQECKEILSSIWEELKETFANIAKWIVDILPKTKAKSYYKIKHLADYGKKHRTRKKNLKRLQKIIEKEMKP